MVSYSQLQQSNLKLLNEGHPQKVIDNLETICQNQEVPFKLHLIYVQALMKEQQYREAFEEALHYEKQYRKDDQVFQLWIQILLKNSLFIPARIALTQLQTTADAKAVEKQIIALEQDAKLNQVATLQKKLSNFYHIGDQSMLQQRTSLSDADELPLDEYLKGAQFVLRDPFVKPLIRTAVLRTLSDLGVQQKVKFIWLDGHEHEISPAAIPSLKNTKAFQEVLHRLNEKLGQDNPTALQQLQNRFDIQAMILFPYINETIQKPAVWTAVLLGDSAGIDVKEFQKVNQQQRQISAKLK